MTKFNMMCGTSASVSASAADTTSCCASSENNLYVSVLDTAIVSSIIIISIIGLLGLIRLRVLVPYLTLL